VSESLPSAARSCCSSAATALTLGLAFLLPLRTCSILVSPFARTKGDSRSWSRLRSQSASAPPTPIAFLRHHQFKPLLAGAAANPVAAAIGSGPGQGGGDHPAGIQPPHQGRSGGEVQGWWMAPTPPTPGDPHSIQGITAFLPQRREAAQQSPPVRR